MHGDLLPLLLVTFLAALVPFVATRLGWLRLPIVVGEIIAGIIIGKSGLDLIPPSASLSFLAEFGFTYLMFLSGLEMNFEALLAPDRSDSQGPDRWWRRPVVISAAVFGITMILAMAAGQGLAALGWAKSPVLMGLILSTTSLGIVVPVLKERGLLERGYGQTLLVSALMGDFMTLLLLSVAVALVSQGPSVNLLFVLVLLAAFAALVKLAQRAKRVPRLAKLVEDLSHATAEIRVRGAFALMVGWVFLAQSLGVEVILGAFLAGALISIVSGEAEEPHRQKLEAMGYGFFIPIFFINVGLGFDLAALTSSQGSLILVPTLILVGYAVKMLPALLFRLVYTWRRALAAGVLLSTRLSLIIAAAAICLDLELITPGANSAVILMALITCTFSPMIFGRLELGAGGGEREGVIIVGADQLASFLGQRLRRFGEKVTFLHHDQELLADLGRQGFTVVADHPLTDQSLRLAGAENASAVVVLLSDPEEVARVCRMAGRALGVPNLVALASDAHTVDELESLGVHTVQPALATALALEGALHFPASFELLTDVSFDMDLLDATMANRALAGRQVTQVHLPGGALVMGIRRAGEALVPGGDTRLRMGDSLTLVGRPEGLRKAKLMVEGVYAAGLRSTHHMGGDDQTPARPAVRNQGPPPDPATKPPGSDRAK